MTPDELWEKHLRVKDGKPFVGYNSFLAALAEYGAAVRAGAIDDCWNAVNAYITRGPIDGNGCDELAKRNGMVLATNIIYSMVSR